MDRQKNLSIAKGYPSLLGANKIAEGLNFAAEIPCGKEASLVLYRKGAAQPWREIPFAEEYRTGKICALLVRGLDRERLEYNFRIDGTIVQDPYAYGIRGRERFGAAPDDDEHRVRCAFLPEAEYDWEGDAAPALSYRDLILYKVHVRGYTKQCKCAPREKGTFTGLKKMIPYWKELGITGVELMPAYEFQELPPAKENQGLITEKKSDSMINYWGYGPGNYFAPKRSYCATSHPENEFRDLVKALHREGMECIMEFYFPAGTNPLLALKAACFWKCYYHVDGFHFTGEGTPKELLAEDHLLYGTKKMFLYLPERTADDGMTAEYQPGFLQDMRRFLKSDEGMIPAAEYHIRHGEKCVNYMACQDGFTLYDAVSYNYRHNEKNGEDNRDGSEYNYSWNCGVEGPSRKLAVRRLREQQMRNAFLMLLLSQGTPMIYGGDEFANSQNGNNNAYCQDNPEGWIDWKAYRKNEKLQKFVREVIAFRKAHPVFHMEREPEGADYLAKGFPDISFHGERAWYLNEENTCRLLGVMYCGAYGEKPDGTADDFLYVAYNFHWENRTAALPNLPEGMAWKKLADTSEAEEDTWFFEREEEYQKGIELSPRSIVIMAGRKKEE